MGSDFWRGHPGGRGSAAAQPAGSGHRPRDREHQSWFDADGEQPRYRRRSVVGGQQLRRPRAGGYVAAWLAGIEIRFDGVLHGLITWGIATLLTIYLLTSAIGGIIGGGFSALGGIASAAGSGVKEAAKPIAQAAGISPEMLQQQAQAYLQPSNPDPAKMSPQDAQKEIASNLATYVQGGSEAPTAKERIINIMAAQMQISRDDAAKRFDDAEAKLKQTRDQTVQTAKDAADASAAAASKTSFAAFGNLLLGALFAAIGGSLAVQRRLQVSNRVNA